MSDDWWATPSGVQAALREEIKIRDNRIKELEAKLDGRTPMTDDLHRSFPEAGDGRPLPPMGEELMVAGLSAEDARFVAVQLCQNGYHLIKPANKKATEGGH